MKENKNIRIILTLAVLLIGGYYIQQSQNSNSEETLSNIVDKANADITGGGPAK